MMPVPPINAIGAQAHGAFRLSTATVQMYIDRLTSQTGLPVYITDSDIDLADDTQQKNVRPAMTWLLDFLGR